MSSRILSWALSIKSGFHVAEPFVARLDFFFILKVLVNQGGSGRAAVGAASLSEEELESAEG